MHCVTVPVQVSAGIPWLVTLSVFDRIPVYNILPEKSEQGCCGTTGMHLSDEALCSVIVLVKLSLGYSVF